MKKIRQMLPLILIVVLAVGLRLPLLNGSFWLDEAAQALESARPFGEQYKITDDFQPPFLHYLLHFVLYVGHSEWWLRLWGALLPGVISVVATYLLAKKLFSRKVAAVTAILVATNSLHVFLSQELRPYMWSVAWTLLSSYFLWEVVAENRDKKRKSGVRAFIFFVAASIFGLYTSYLYPFVFLSQLAVLLFSKKIKTLFLAIIIPSLAFLPWLSHFLKQLQAGTKLGSLMPGWTQTVSFDQIKSVWLTATKFIYGVSDLAVNPFYVVTFLLLAGLWVAVVVSWLKGRSLAKLKSRLSFRSPLFFTVVMLGLPFVLAWLVSFVVPVIQPKRVIFLLPWFYMLISAVSVTVWQKKNHQVARYFVGGLLSLLFLLNIFSLYDYYTDVRLQRENWRDLYEEIKGDYALGEAALLFSYPDAFSPWNWYRKWDEDEPLAIYTTGTYYLPTAYGWYDKVANLSNYETILLFDYLRDLTDPNNQLSGFLQNLGYREQGFYDYKNIGLVRVFGR